MQQEIIFHGEDKHIQQWIMHAEAMFGLDYIDAVSGVVSLSTRTRYVKPLSEKAKVIAKHLVGVVRNLNAMGCPCCEQLPDGSFTNNWGLVRRGMVRDLGRMLSPEEMDVLTLSRMFGPAMGFDEQVKYELFAAIWPSGNNGAWMTWSEMERVLRAISK